MRKATQFRTLSEVDALFLSVEPKLGQSAWNRVLFHTKCRDRPRMDHVCGCDLHHNGLTDRYDDRCIRGQKEVFFGEARFNQLFFDSERYDLSAVGRVKMNMRLALDAEDTQRTLRREDIFKSTV